VSSKNEFDSSIKIPFIVHFQQSDPIGRIFVYYVGVCLPWAVFLITEVAQILGTNYMYNEFNEKMGWGTFWADFLQTDLVPLIFRK
jgi:hypothetical protein